MEIREKNMYINKRNILFISSTGETGGGPVQISLLINNLINKMNFHLVCPKENCFGSYLYKNSDVHFLYIKERKLSLIDYIRILIYLKKNPVALIHSHGKGAGAIGRLVSLLSKKPHIYTFHGIHTLNYTLLYKYIYVFYENLFGLIDREKIFVSDSEKAQAIKNGIKVRNNYQVINNGVKEYIKTKEEDNFQKKIFKKFRINNKKKRIISVCRLVKQKNIFEIIKIAKICQDYTFIIIGDGPLYKQVINLINYEKIRNVTLTGRLDNVYPFLINSDIFLSTSLYEGLPISVLEAMSVGLPILASKVIGNIDTIEDGKSGFFYDLGDIYQAANIIKNIMTDKKLKEKMGKASKLRQRHFFSCSKMCAEHYSLYSKYF